MSDPPFDLEPTFQVTYSRLIADYAISNDGQFAVVDELGRVMLNCDVGRKLRFDLSLQDFDHVRGCQFLGSDNRVVFTVKQSTYIADFGQRTLRQLPTAEKHFGSAILSIGNGNYATISSSQDAADGGIEIAIWSAGTLAIQHRIRSPLTFRVNRAITLPDSSAALLGCVGGTVLQWSLSGNKIEPIAEVRGSIMGMVIHPRTGNVITGQWPGFATELFLSERTIKEYTEFRGSLSAMAPFDDERLVLITSQDAIGVFLATDEFAFWNKFSEPPVRSARFSNNSQFVAFDRERRLEAYRVVEMFERFKF